MVQTAKLRFRKKRWFSTVTPRTDASPCGDIFTDPRQNWKNKNSNEFFIKQKLFNF